MTDEQINAAIARALNADEHWMIQKDYCSDLNAMHEAEKVFDAMSSKMFGGWLLAICSGKNAAWHANARQRAEAFLRTLGKWEEVQK